MSEEVLKVEQGSLYPALHRLELDELIEAEWGLSGNKRRAKFYRLTLEGRKHLAGEQTHWARLSAAVNRVLLTEST
jgi:DNA-binding PadR family transcriptional regulator